MYKYVLVHHVIPGKLPELKRWFSNADSERKAEDPEYVPPKRYVTVIGDLTQVVAEFPLQVIPDPLPVWAEGVEGGGVYDLVVPGLTQASILKEIESDS